MSGSEVVSDPAFPGDDLYQDIFLNCADAVVIVGPGQRITRVNASAEDMFGYPADTLVGQSIHALIPERIRNRHRDLVAGFRESKAPARFMEDRDADIRGLRADGTEFPVNVSILNSGKGAGASLVAIVRDISRQKALEENLEKLAGTDPLTGAMNRRNIILRAEEEVERAQRYNHSLSVAMIDIDRFKRVNDTFGHLVGDRAICHVADTISAGLRKSDRLGRWGGEEFLLVLPEVDEKSAVKVLQRLRQDIENAPVPGNDGDAERITLTVSIGATGLRETDHALAELIARADKALYRAKSAGRNKVCALENAGPGPGIKDIA